MKVGVMQPYFLPYIGYWQLLKFVDRFVIYDNIQYVKRGWINRNRYLKDGSDTLFSIPLKKDSDYLDINKRVISDSFSSKKLINKFDIAYKSAPYYLDVLPLLIDIINISHKNLFRYIYESVILMCSFLDIDSSKIIISSDIEIDHSLRSEEKVLAICKAQNASTYINPIGGVEMYHENNFNNVGMQLQFLRAKDLVYNQYIDKFVPSLSIIDVMMFNSVEETKLLLKKYELV